MLVRFKAKAMKAGSSNVALQHFANIDEFSYTYNKQANWNEKTLQASHKTIQVQLNPVLFTGCEFKKGFWRNSFFFFLNQRLFHFSSQKVSEKSFQTSPPFSSQLFFLFSFLSHPLFTLSFSSQWKCLRILSKMFWMQGALYVMLKLRHAFKR